jgi:hypothetical protein
MRQEQPFLDGLANTSNRPETVIASGAEFNQVVYLIFEQKARSGARMTDHLAAFHAAATPEQLRGLRLEAIFMPEGRRLRDALYKSNPNPRFVHYTRAEAALEIIRKKRLWLRNTTAMIDYREIHHGYSLLRGWFDVAGNLDKFIAVFDSIHPGAAREAIKSFNRFWTSSEIGIQTQTYISSISEHDSSEDEHGRLSMWRAFGVDAAARVALVFSVPPFSGAVAFLQCIFSPVAYLNEPSAHSIFMEVIVNAESERDFLRTISYEDVRNLIFFSFVVASTCVKHEGFKEEREWRIVYLPGYYPPIKPPRIESEVVSLSGVPQIVYKFPLDASVAPEIAAIDIAAMFDRLIIGPSRYPWVMYEAFKRTLEEARVSDPGAKIITSSIPIRS